MTTDAPPTVERFFRAMQAGASSEAEMMSLFAHDAVYVEPFSGQPCTHAGKPAIREAFAQGWNYPLPDMRITIDRFDVSADRVVVDWTCHSPGLPGGQGRGTNVFALSGGLIVRLETTLR